MSEPSAIERDVQALRRAAERRDWDVCRGATEALLLRLAPGDAVRLTRDFAARRLPAFERQQPGVLWPRELLQAVEGPNAANSGRAWPEEDEFAGPGGNSFKKAVEALWRASLRRGEASECVRELVDALSSAILSELVEHWGARNPDAWALWYQLALSGEGDVRMSDIQLAMMKAPDVQRLELAGWREVASLLEAALRPEGGSG